ncbi:ABC transporter ATP-binding protein [Bremerella sp. JC817]|uniref:ABC transporter ATP-binding protein n=1 Tax=Bremerella sp. JC817 TaxID=3231756 RepID=UPI00345B3848
MAEVVSTEPVPAALNTAGAAPLQLLSVTKRFRQGDSVVEAVRDVSLTIEQGEFVAIMGASGSGKSTLLHVSAGLTSADEGKVLVEGYDLSRWSDRKLTQFRRRRIGLVFQAFNLVPTLTAEENILLPAYTDGHSELSATLDPLLDRLGISQRRKHRPDALSGGEQQRVALARALITQPALILADEPTGSLDSVTGQSICQLLKDLCEQEKRTIAVVTHEPSVAIWAKRVLVMKDGQLIQDFPTSDFQDTEALASHYQHVVNTTS